jgi:hypothetical protein
MQDSAGRDFPDGVRCNRVHLHGNADSDGLLPGEINYLAAEQRLLTRRGLWLVLCYSRSGRRCRVLHFDALGRRHIGWVNAREIESEELFDSM